MKKYLFFTLSVLLFPAISLAGNFEKGETYTLSPSVRINDNFYVVGKDVTISGMVNGDSLSIASKIISDGTVTGDSLFFGGEVSILGKVLGDARAVGGDVKIDSYVGGDLISAGGTINITENAKIEKDVALAGGEVNVRGTIGRTVRIIAGKALIDGEIDGNFDFYGGELTIGPNAKIYGEVKIEGEQKANISEKAFVKGRVTYIERNFLQLDGKKVRDIFGFAVLFRLIILTVAILLFLYLFPKKIQKIVNINSSSFGKSFLVGIGGIILIPVCIILLTSTILGIFVAVVTLICFILCFILSILLSGVIFGSWVYKFYSKTRQFPETITWKIAVPGIILLSLINFIPVIGIFLNFVIFISTFGTILRYVWGISKGERIKV